MIAAVCFSKRCIHGRCGWGDSSSNIEVFQIEALGESVHAHDPSMLCETMWISTLSLGETQSLFVDDQSRSSQRGMILSNEQMKGRGPRSPKTVSSSILLGERRIRFKLLRLTRFDHFVVDFGRSPKNGLASQTSQPTREHFTTPSGFN